MSNKRLTVPKEFNFASESRIRNKNKPKPTMTEENIPLAEMLRRLENQTPETWKRVARAPSPVKKLELTVPKPFNFHSTRRRRSIRNSDVSIKTKTTNMFKARPLNRKIFESGGDLGVPRIPKKPLTEPISPKFSTLKRSKVKNQSLNEDVSDSKNEKKQKESKKNILLEEKLELTVPEPFKLLSVERHLYEQRKLMQRIEEEKRKQEKMRKFKANPLPIVEPFRPVLDLKFTVPKPFELECEKRSELEQAKLREKMQAEKENMVKRTLFKSRPFINKNPPQIRGSTKPLTEIDPNFVLKTDIRASKRKEFDMYLMEKEAQKEREEEEKRRQEEERMKREIKKLRASLIHKPLPIPETLYNPEILKTVSTAPLTEPKTPNFSYKRKKIKD